MKLRTTLFALAAMLSSATIAHAEQPRQRDHRGRRPAKVRPVKKPAWNSSGWTRLGDQVVHGRNDRDVIRVGASEGRFTTLTFVVEDSDLQIKDIVIYFKNGEKFSPRHGATFSSGSRTALFDLPGTARAIDRIEFMYGNLPGGGRARIEVWGHLDQDRDGPTPLPHPTTPAPQPTPQPAPRPTPQPAPLPAPIWDPHGWTKLGEKHVDAAHDYDILKVGAYQGRFDQITLAPDGNDVEITRVVVHFAKGKKMVKVFRDGKRGVLTFDLPGNDRVIKKIELGYRNLTTKRRTIVVVYGRDTRAAQPTPPGPVFDPRGWIDLGSQEVKGKNDRDHIKVGAKEGRFAKLTFVVENSDLEMHDIVIHFANGDTFSPHMKLVFREGERSRAIDLPGHDRQIKKIEFRYSNIYGDHTAARVRVYGLVKR